MWLDVTDNHRRVILLLLRIVVLQILRNIDHVRGPIPFSPYIAARFAVAAAPAAGRH